MTFREQKTNLIISCEWYLQSLFSIDVLQVENESINDLAHVSTLLSYLSNVIKRFIQLAQALIRVQFLQK